MDRIYLIWQRHPYMVETITNFRIMVSMTEYSRNSHSDIPEMRPVRCNSPRYNMGTGDCLYPLGLSDQSQKSMELTVDFRDFH